MTRVQSTLLGIFLLAGIIGFFDATYLATNHFLNITPPCIATSGCDTVTTSEYSKILGIPVALLGAFFYLSAVMAGIYFIDSRKKVAIKIMVLLGIVGFVMSLWFVSLQLFVIKALCFYCLISALTSTTLCITAILLYQKTKELPLDTSTP